MGWSRILVFLCLVLQAVDSKVSMWIGEDEVRAFAGVPMEIVIIENDRLADYLRRGPKFSATLPPIPPLANSINVTWTSGKGKRKYIYKFLRIKAEDPTIMEGLKLSIPKSGEIPRQPTDFQVSLPCTGQKAGIANFKLVLDVRDGFGKPLEGSPLRLKLGKYCRLQNETCLVQKCVNGGICTPYGDCLCPKGFVGRRCETGAHCKRDCNNRGVCLRDDFCKCRPGFRGKYCQRKYKRGRSNSGNNKGSKRPRKPESQDGNDTDVRKQATTSETVPVKIRGGKTTEKIRKVTKPMEQTKKDKNKRQKRKRRRNKEKSSEIISPNSD